MHWLGKLDIFLNNNRRDMGPTVKNGHPGKETTF